MSQPAAWRAITVDCIDPRRVANFWSALLASDVIEPGADRPGWFRIAPFGPEGPFMNFQPVKEPRSERHGSMWTSSLATSTRQ